MTASRAHRLVLLSDGRQVDDSEVCLNRSLIAGLVSMPVIPLSLMGACATTGDTAGQSETTTPGVHPDLCRSAAG